MSRPGRSWKKRARNYLVAPTTCCALSEGPAYPVLGLSQTATAFPRAASCLEPLQVEQAARPASRLAQSSSQASRAWQGKARPSPRDFPSAGRRQAVRVGKLPRGFGWCGRRRGLRLGRRLRLGGDLLCGLIARRRLLLRRLVTRRLIFAEPLSSGLRLGACDGRFFLEAGPAVYCRPNRRCKKCKKPPFVPPLMVAPE